MTPNIERIRAWIRRNARHYLADANITSVGLGYKIVDGKTTDELSLQFTVRTKTAVAELEALGTELIPESLQIDSETVVTDVVERSFVPSHRVVPEAERSARKTRRDPLVPGISVSHPSVSAGTLGAIMYDRTSGKPVVLSNWHVLHGPEGAIGDDVLQPGAHDDNSGDRRNVFGTLLRSHLGAAGDAAISSVVGREIDAEIMDLGIVPEEIADPDLGDRVVKSGRTTGVSHGVVSRIETMVSLDYGEGSGEHTIGCFEIQPDPRRENDNDPAGTGMLSDGGDSGAVWMLKSGNGRTSRVMAGLHFAGSDAPDGEEHALACLASSVRDVLDVSLDSTVAVEAASEAGIGGGFDEAFLSEPVAVPSGADSDAPEVDGSVVIPYTHFSLQMSGERRLARWVAWNIDGGSMQRLSRDGIGFRLDSRLPNDVQAGEDLYSRNDLDRGHIARRADLLWGPRPEAQRANEDSFFFTNIAPQMNTFNQSGRSGVWGELEDALFSEVDVEGLRVSVIGGPIFKDTDRDYRGFQIPREFFKVIYYVADGTLRVRPFVLTQDLSDLEVIDLAEFSTYQVTLAELTERTGLSFAEASEQDGVVTEAAGPRRLASVRDVAW
ncbi:MAG: DNA/RNA non-specific endonuclease [Gulosibacter sp.]|uniref:DNA/RNA non-specific endonuclease n=1 Tax=Gulosibacter sp. TaxID=2817531 RepID=UPI003F8F3527